jgi:hypothetical protein
MSKSRSPLTCPPRVPVKYPAALSRSRHLFNTYFLATAAQPSVVEVVGAVEGTSVQPALGEEVENILQAISKFAQVRVTCPTDAECGWIVHLDPPEMCRIRARRPKSRPPGWKNPQGALTN